MFAPRFMVSYISEVYEYHATLGRYEKRDEMARVIAAPATHRDEKE